MRKSVFIAALLALAALPVTAETMVTDTDGDGAYSFEELQAAYPDLTQELFDELDGDGDGAISADELVDAKEAGQLAE